MNWIALRMLTGDRTKFLGIVFGVTFASFLIAQQASIFCGLMSLTQNAIKDIDDAPIWVMDPGVEYIDDVKPMSDNDLFRVRGVAGIRWAVRLYKALGRARLPNGKYQQVILVGLDDATLAGAPDTMLLGDLNDLQAPDAIIMDDRGYRRLWPDEPLEVGKVFEMNDRRAVLVGICRVSKTFQTFPVIYARYSQAVRYNPPERKVLTFVLAHQESNLSAQTACERIETQTGLKALTQTEFSWETIWYYMRETGIPFNFGITVVLGFIVGTAIAAQTFYLFTIENLKQFASLKALGTSNWRLMRIILIQALVVGWIGFGLGIGMAAVLGRVINKTDRLAFLMPWQVVVLSAGAVFFIVIAASLLCIRRVLVVETAIVFQD